MKAKLLDTKMIIPGDNVTLDLSVKSFSSDYLIVRIYAIPNPPKDASLDELVEISSRVAKWLSSENLNI